MTRQTDRSPADPDLSSLTALAGREGIDIRPTLLRVMTDLYVRKPEHTEHEAQQFTELSLRLIDEVDAATRALVAEKIAGYPNAPAQVRQRLLRDHITLQPPAPDQPEETPAPPATAAAPPTPPIEPAGSAHALSETFFASDSNTRRLIMLNLPYASIRPAEPIAPATAKEAIHRLEAAALGHNNEVFARELERTLGISREQARRVIDDPHGEPLVVAAAALAMPATVLQRILLCLNPEIAQSVQRVYELAMLHEDLEPEAARKLVAVWQAAHRAALKSAASTPQAPHQPLHQDDRAARPATLPVSRPKIRWDEHALSRKAEGA